LLWAHPALPFVTAYIFRPSLAVADNIDAFIDVPKVEPRSLPYPPEPLDKLMLARYRGEIQFWRDLALRTIAEEMSVEDWAELLDQADLAGWLYARDHDVSLGIDVPDKERWWYMPLSPITTANDIREAAPSIAEKMRRVYGTQRVDDTVRKLSEQGMSQAQIVRELGVGPDLVRDALRGDSGME
jgi:hypothetical protein